MVSYVMFILLGVLVVAIVAVALFVGLSRRRPAQPTPATREEAQAAAEAQKTHDLASGLAHRPQPPTPF